MKFTARTKKSVLIDEVVSLSIMDRENATKTKKAVLLSLIAKANDQNEDNSQVVLSSIDDQLDEVAECVLTQNDVDVTGIEIQNDELNAKIEILASILKVKEDLTIAQNKCKKLQRRLDFINNCAQRAYNKICYCANRVASTYDKRYFPLFDNLMSAIYELQDIVKNPSTSVIDMHKIVDERQRRLEAEKLEQERRRAAEEAYLKSERSFITGDIICFNNGVPYMSEQCSDNEKYAFCKEWYDYVEEWIKYIYTDFLAKSKPVKLNIRKAFINEFEIYGVDNDILEMIEDIISEFCKDNDVERALAYFTAIIDCAF